MKKLFLLLTIFAWAAFGADLSGTWKGALESPDGKFEHSFVLKAEGDKLTGEMVSEALGKFKIDEGKVDGDTLSFTVNLLYNGDPVKIIVRGKASGNDINIQLETENGDFATNYVVSKTV